MRKKLFLWSAITLAVLMLVLAFENIWLVQQYFVLFFTFNASSTIIILLSGVLGFLVGFFSMLYSYEVRKEKSLQEESDYMGSPPAASLEETTPKKEEAAPKEPEPKRLDSFDEDDEVLG